MSVGVAGTQDSAGSFAGGGGTLESLGLVDPSTGMALGTADWQPGPTAVDPRAERDSMADDQPPQSPAQQNQWDSPANPYKVEAERLRQAATPDPAQQARQQFEQRQTMIQSQAQAAYATLIQQGVPAQQAQALVGAGMQAELARAQMEADRAALLPAAKREVSERIAREFSLPNAKIDPSEILNEGSVDAMRARAKALAETRRGQSFQARRESGADRVERGAGPGTKIDYDNLSPHNLIKLGVLRGQNG